MSDIGGGSVAYESPAGNATSSEDEGILFFKNARLMFLFYYSEEGKEYLGLVGTRKELREAS